MGRRCARGFLCFAVALAVLAAARRHPAWADVPLGGFIPYVGLGLTDEYETFDSDPTGAFFIADRSVAWGGSPLGPGSAAFFDLALLDTGAATHILTQAAGSASGFAIQAEGLRGTNFQTVFGASGSIDLRINDPLGVYVTGLSNRTSAGATLVLNTATMRGQTSVATLEGDADWKLPNVVGLPMAAQHGIVIRNDQPQLFTYQGRTVRTPNVQLIDLGTGDQQGILRRTELVMHPSAAFIAGPFYLQGAGSGLDFNFHNDPRSPTNVENGGLFVATNLTNGTRSVQDKEFLFDTGADLTVVSSSTAAKLGFDILLDEPDFELEVEGAGGVTPGIPGFYIDELEIPSVGGSFILHNVPVAVVDLPNPSDPGNFVPGILGMHLFTGRNLVIDASPAAVPGSPGSKLYIGNPVYETHTWAAAGSGGAWGSASSWTGNASPSIMWDAQAVNSSPAQQTASVTSSSTVYRLTVGAASGAGALTVQIGAGATLTTFGETLINTGGNVRLTPGGKLDAQFVNIAGGSLTGSGDVFVGTGPVTGAVRNLSGRVSPDSQASAVGDLKIGGDLVNLDDGTLIFDLAGTGAGQYDVIEFDRNLHLAGTLQVRLSNFTPSVGNSFTLLSGGDAVFGTFDQLLLPGGFTWNVSYQATQVVLMVTGLGALPGDFDGNGHVNAADLVVWRTGFGTQYSGQDYLVWQRNVGAGGAATVAPEPASGLLALATFLASGAFRAKQRLPRPTSSDG